jgi:cytochrome c oxidase subunit 2
MACGGGTGTSPKDDEVTPPTALVQEAVTDPERALDELMALGARVYARRCASCHQVDGHGIRGAFPPLVGQGLHMGDCATSIEIVVNGMLEAITIAGVLYEGGMPPSAEGLSDGEIAAVITFQRESWGNDYGPCLPEEVTAWRLSSR